MGFINIINQLYNWGGPTLYNTLHISQTLKLETYCFFPHDKATDWVQKAGEIYSDWWFQPIEYESIKLDLIPFLGIDIFILS